jgi:hypothetical protein
MMNSKNTPAFVKEEMYGKKKKEATKPMKKPAKKKAKK